MLATRVVDAQMNWCLVSESNSRGVFRAVSNICDWAVLRR